MKSIRLLALDIDGTILTREKQLTNRTKAAIEAAAGAGIAAALVTGRPLYGIPEELRQRLRLSRCRGPMTWYMRCSQTELDIPSWSRLTGISA